MPDLSSKGGLTRPTLSGFCWLFSGAGVQCGVRLIVLMGLARLLTPGDFGVVAAAMVIVGFAEVFSQIGIGQSLVQIRNLERRHVKTGLTITLLFGGIIGGLIAISADFVGQFYRMPELGNMVRVLAINFPLRAMAAVGESLLQRELQFRRLAMVEILSYGLGYGLVSMVLASLNYGAWALAISTVAHGAFRLTIVVTMLRRQLSWGFDLAAAKELLFLGGGFASARILNYLALQGDYLVVGRWLGANALGLYSRAYNLMAMPVRLVGEALGKVLFPTLSQMQEEKERLKRGYIQVISLVSLIVLPMSAAVFVLAPELIEIILGQGWADATTAFRILALGMYFRVGYKVSGTLTRATGMVYSNAGCQGLYAGMVIVGAFVGRHWGLSGVAIGVLLALGLHFLFLSRLGLQSVFLTWREFVKAHLHGLVLFAFVGLETWGLASVLRSFSMSSFVTLATTLFCVMASLMVLCLWVPRNNLSNDAFSLLQGLVASLFRKTPILSVLHRTFERRLKTS